MDKQKVVGVSFKFKDNFSMKSYYEMVRFWLDEEGFTNTDMSVPENFMETFYFQREAQLSGKEHWIWWRTKKRINSFIEWKLDIDYHTLAMKSSEVMHRGKKIKLDKGEVETFITATLITDPDKKWENHPFLKNFESLFRRRIYKKELEKQEIEFRKTVYRMQAAMKEFLEMKSYLPKELPLSDAKGKSMV